jgi:ABC-type lipoprotein release transport system permease subunit
MVWLESLKVALSCLWANKLRSVLTMLGVIFGVGSVIVMVAIVEGARVEVMRQFEQLGSRLIIVFFSPEREEREQITVSGLKLEDAEAIREECSLIKAVSPETPAARKCVRAWSARSANASRCAIWRWTAGGSSRATMRRTGAKCAS